MAQLDAQSKYLIRQPIVILARHSPQAAFIERPLIGEDNCADIFFLLANTHVEIGMLNAVPTGRDSSPVSGWQKAG